MYHSYQRINQRKTKLIFIDLSCLYVLKKSVIFVFLKYYNIKRFRSDLDSLIVQFNFVW